MDLNEKSETFKDGLRELEAMVGKTELAVIGGAETTPLITNNVNFYTKSFLISACAHLEMCIKEIVFEIAKDIDARLSSAAIPSSVIEWRLGQKKKSDSSLISKKLLSINMTKKEVDDLVSGNVYRTKEALALVGIELAAEKVQWELWKDSIQAIVTRRNNIVHHNDDASDLSLGDIRSYIKSIINYIDFVINACHFQHDIGLPTSNVPVA
ncbi:HEPN domain-containing protein [Simplicispira metamorpha]|uniref:RiboL-PSP-HEPN domain-containing protein n=1 Tax=Simplicispira metamorpha TaxID=80881 RepID=A0A4R2N770_9BURK|nr:HEPN domain-containing protein [Simplicispira metamorpha]TCP16784.1 hypothetical protein EV674_11689 [Simplicispira metamorpha]